jgi:hypothetical protein
VTGLGIRFEVIGKRFLELQGDTLAHHAYTVHRVDQGFRLRGKNVTSHISDHCVSLSLSIILVVMDCCCFRCEPFAYPAPAAGITDETMAPQQGQRGRNTLKAQIFGYENLFDTPDTDESLSHRAPFDRRRPHPGGNDGMFNV